jgi:outer membrane lipoprotein-sorting protein
MQCADKLKRVLPALLMLTIAAAGASCKRSGDSGNQANLGGNENRGNEESPRVPPFATKEPERYQATRVVTSTPDNGSASSGGTVAQTSVTFIARDGERRREDYELGGSKISSLQLPSGTYLLFAERKIFAELNSTADNGSKPLAASIPQDFSPEKLLNESRPEAHYDDQGLENIDGRATRKYRVTLKGKAGEPGAIVTESIVWVDEKLGMPIRSEMSSPGGARVVTELRDIKETVDNGVFDLPQDFRRVTEKEFFAQLKPNGGE